MRIHPVNKNSWNKFLNEQKPHTFLQSWNWGEFNKALQNKIFRLGIYEDGTLVGLCLVIKITARRGSFLFVPHGPTLEVKSSKFKVQSCVEALADYLKNLAKHEKCSFVRISPLMIKTTENENMFKNLGFRRAPMHMHSELNWILDITKSEEELLKNMRKTTRYSINKAQKDGVQIIVSDELKDIEIFNKLYEETAKRQRFTPFSLNYLRNEFEAFKTNNEVLLFFAKYKEEIIGSAVIIFTNGGAFYHQGATSLKYPKVPAAYLMQWEIIKEAKRRGCEFYNFWGVVKESDKNHPWAGLSLFKKGFGGYEEEYLPARDLVLNSKYWLTYSIEKARKIYRRL